MNENVLGTERIGKLFLQYSIPTITAMLFLGLNTIVGGLFVGRYIGVDALACVNIAMPFTSFLFALSVVIGMLMLWRVRKCMHLLFLLMA